MSVGKREERDVGVIGRIPYFTPFPLLMFDSLTCKLATSRTSLPFLVHVKRSLAQDLYFV